MSKKPAAPATPSPSRAERVLGGMIVSTLGLTILSFLAVILASGIFHVQMDVNSIWPVIIMLPRVALPLAFVFMLSLLILNLRRRRREASGATR